MLLKAKKMSSSSMSASSANIKAVLVTPSKTENTTISFTGRSKSSSSSSSSESTSSPDNALDAVTGNVKVLKRATKKDEFLNSSTDSDSEVIPTSNPSFNVNTKVSANGSRSVATLKCPFRGCAVQLAFVNGSSFIKHLKDVHPDYQPTKQTIKKFSCKNCPNCGLVNWDHVCSSSARLHVLTASENQEAQTLGDGNLEQSPIIPCPVRDCTFSIEQPLTNNFLDHIKSKHPFYRPINSTLFRYGCMKCIKCGIVSLGHVCASVPRQLEHVGVAFKMPGSESYMQTVDVSWTVTLSDIDITQTVYKAITKIIDDYFHIGVVCLERGNKNKRLHAQCTGRLYFPNDEKSVRWLGASFRKELQAVSHVPVKHQLKAYGKNQTVRAMVGYCMKQSQHPFFQMHVKGISEAELNAARAEYSTLSADPADGKVVIIRKNLFKMMFGAYKTDYYPTAMTFVEVLTNMLNRDYYLDSTFFMGPGLNKKKCEIMWEHISQRKIFKTVDVEKLVFEEKGGLKSQTFTEEVLYSLNDFWESDVKEFVVAKVLSRCNFMVIGDTNIGKTQLVLSALQAFFRGNSRFIIVRTKEELKNIRFQHHTILFDDFDFDTFSISECIRLLDRDTTRKSIECKYEVATLFRHQQVIVVGNQKHQLFVDNKMLSNRILCFPFDVTQDLRVVTSSDEDKRETSRGNHLLKIPVNVDELLQADENHLYESELDDYEVDIDNRMEDINVTCASGNILLQATSLTKVKRGNGKPSGHLSASSDDSRSTKNGYSQLDQKILSQALRTLDKRTAVDYTVEDNYFTFQASKVMDEPNLVRPKRTRLGPIAKAIFEDEAAENNSDISKED